jgi:hypothetical protein
MVSLSIKLDFALSTPTSSALDFVANSRGTPLTYTVVGSRQWRAMNASVQVYIEHNNDSDAAIAFLATSVTDGGCMGG